MANLYMYNEEIERYLRRNAGTMLPEDHYRARVKQFVEKIRKLEEAESRNHEILNSGTFFQHKLKEMGN